MLLPPNLRRDPGRALTLAGAPEGHDARLLAELAQREPNGLLHVALDDGRAARLSDLIAFYAPDLELVSFPAWDCLPYDRVSPNVEIVGQRITALARLLTKAERPRLIIATVNSITQRVAPSEMIEGAIFSVTPGGRIDMDRLQTYFAENGYVRAETVREPGEYAVRGGIVDLFPPGFEEPARLDLFGDEVEKIRSFDPLSQRTTGEREALSLRPMAEFTLDEASVARFRTGYRELFGAVVDEDPLYEAVTAGRRYAGMEHWLPLLHQRLETLFDYLPDTAVSMDPQADEAIQARLAQIAEFHQARLDLQKTEARANAPVYKPLPPNRLYLAGEECAFILAGRPVVRLSPFGHVEGAVDSIDGGGRRGRDFSDVRAQQGADLYRAIGEYIAHYKSEGRLCLIAAYSQGSRDRLAGVLIEHGLERVVPVAGWADAQRLPKAETGIVVLALETGFVGPDLCVLSEQDILGDRLARPQKKRRRSDKFTIDVGELNEGDLVVHAEHGIGRYAGLETLTVSGAAHDCVRIVYAGDDKLYVPVENIDVLSRYGSEETAVALDKLGGGAWQARKAKVKKRLKDMAEQLLKIAAARLLHQAEPLSSPTGIYEEFAARFPYPETEDQLRAIENILEDLGSGKPMDRLVCGDVGFGKTEVALRAAFIVAMSGLQVAVIVPTTLLSRQHFQTFQRRFAGLPLRVAQLSRLVSSADAAKAKEGLADGSVDIVIGTHALLGKTVKFARLGLLVVDEEQHFGVKQKEKLKEMGEGIHVLTLTATPIPRTLQMALAGVRELSLITTPPVDRLAVRTFVLPYDPVVIREAILREQFRGGQSFYICPRLEDMPHVEERLKKLVPEIKYVTAHGQLPAVDLEARVAAFYDGEYDLLLATNIVESGLDIPRANTMIIHRADLFGLAQLYQLRGRIGRSKLRGYAYLTHSAGKLLTKSAQQRLEVIETLDSLGAGFTLASHDLDLRGAGNLLGEEQSGHIREVGVELYQQMLEEAVAAAKAGVPEEAVETQHWQPQINLGIPVLIPETYVKDLNVRLNLYRRLAELKTREELDAFGAELIDRFGPLPPEVENLLDTVVIKQLCRSAGVERLDVGPKGAVLSFRNNTFAHVDQLMSWVMKQAGTVKIRPDQKLVYSRAWEEPARRLTGARSLMSELALLAA
ncbi:MAG TPA: transcription-repair coupling factor [Alphaproteobacteria bacterium]|nr:transcription-repair coupling factor [Alphaproteobacteria bacterium]